MAYGLHPQSITASRVQIPRGACAGGCRMRGSFAHEVRFEQRASSPASPRRPLPIEFLGRRWRVARKMPQQPKEGLGEMHRIFLTTVGVAALGGALATTSTDALAQASPAAPAAPAAPTSNAMTTPALTGPLAANPNPFKFDAGPLGPVYVTGALSGLAFAQTNPVATDKTFRGDISNGQVIVQNTAGLVQFYAQAGVYSFPILGAAYLPAKNTNNQFFGPLPVGYLKLAPTDSFSIQVGKLPTLFGAEYAFTFENMNIERGLLWNQEPIISRGVQANLTTGPVAWSASLNDGFYSGQIDWATGAATWTINPANSLEVVGGGNYGRDSS